MLGELESYRSSKGLHYYLQKILGAIEFITEVRIFLIPLSNTDVFESENFRHFCTKNSVTWAVKCEK